MVIAQREYTFVEPHPCGGTCTVTVTEAQAIEYQREVGLGKNYDYPTDEEALSDFLIVHWATPLVTSHSFTWHFWKFIHNTLIHPFLGFPYEPRWLQQVHDWTAKRCPGGG